MRELNGLVGTEPIPAARHTQQFTHGITELVSGPLRIVRAAPVDIADRNPLHIRLVQEVQHDSQSLSSDTNEREVHFVTRGNVAGAAENTPGDNGESEHGG